MGNCFSSQAKTTGAAGAHPSAAGRADPPTFTASKPGDPTKTQPVASSSTPGAPALKTEQSAPSTGAMAPGDDAAVAEPATVTEAAASSAGEHMLTGSSPGAPVGAEEAGGAAAAPATLPQGTQEKPSTLAVSVTAPPPLKAPPRLPPPRGASPGGPATPAAVASPPQSPAAVDTPSPPVVAAAEQAAA